MFINNQELKIAIKDAISANTLEGLPSELAKQVVPIIDCTPKNNRITIFCKGGSKETTGASTLFTTPSGKNTYLTAATLTYSKDATCDMALGYVALGVTIDGVVTYPLLISTNTLTAQSGQLCMQFKDPLKLDSGTNVSITASGAYTAGTMARSAVIYGFYTERF